MAQSVRPQPCAGQKRPQPAKPRPVNLSPQATSGFWCVQQENCDPQPRDGGRGRTVVISDIHIGTNGSTCWYQKSVHECYLASLFDYVVAHATGVDDRVTKLVILGDLFDFWTYPP